MANKFDPILGKLRQSDVISVLPTQEPTIDDLFGVESEGSCTLDEVAGNGIMNLSSTISGIYYVVYKDGTELTGGFGNNGTIEIDCSAGITADSHTFVVKMRVGKYESTGTSSFLVDVLPNAPLIDSVNGDTSTPGSGSDDTPDVVISGVEDGDLVTVYDGTTEVGSDTATTTSITITTDALSEDEHILTAKITRNSLDSAASDSFAYTYEVGGVVDVLDQEETTADGGIATGGDCAFTARFTPTQSGFIQKVEFLLKSSTGDSTVATAELWSMSGSSMGSKIATIQQRSLSSIPSGNTWYTFTTAGTDATITASTEYCLVLSTTAPAGYIHTLAHDVGSGEHYATAIPIVSWGDHGQRICFKQYYST